jgi:hypothetical protein
VPYGVAPRLLPAREIPSSGAGRVFGVSTWPGREQKRLVQPPLGATCHSLLLGPSGSGKSWLLANLFLGQVAANDGAVLLDMKGDTASDVLSRIEPKRHRDVLVLEPSNGLAVPGLRCFSGEPELAADLWLNIFRGCTRGALVSEASGTCVWPSPRWPAILEPAWPTCPGCLPMCATAEASWQG